MPRLSLVAAVLFSLAVAPVARAEDTTPPLIRHNPLTKASKGESVTISAQMEDESEIFAPTLYYRYPGAKGYSSVAMTRKGDSFVATVQATADIEYWIEAYDEFGNGPTREGTPDRPHKITVADKGGTRTTSTTPSRPPPPRPTPQPQQPEALPEAPPEPPPEVAEPPPLPMPEPIPLPEEESKPIYTQWWFYAGAGAVVVAAVVGIVVAAQPAPVHQNTFGVTVAHP